MPSRCTARLRVLIPLVAALATAGPVPVARAGARIVELGAPRIVLEHKDDRGQDAYDYAPSTMQEGGGYTTWWCGTGDDGRFDRIYRARSSKVGGPWTGRREVLKGKGDRAFDGVHTCDPDVIRDERGYTMYYGGLGDTRGAAGTDDDFTAIGVATSPDGVHWTRQNGGRPIISAARTGYGVAYGAGQPSVVLTAGWYTMIYTSVARPAPGVGPRGGEYAVRARDPLFSKGLQERRGRGWVALPDRRPGGLLAVHRNTPLFGEDHCVNLAYLSPAHVFATIGCGGSLRFLDADLLALTQPVRSVVSPGFHEQRSFLRSPRGRVMRTAGGPYDLSLMSAIKGRNDRLPGDPFSWDLGMQPMLVAFD